MADGGKERGGGDASVSRVFAGLGKPATELLRRIAMATTPGDHETRRARQQTPRTAAPELSAHYRA